MKLLWFASWYPNKLDKFTGDFIQRHAQAVSQYCEVEVIYVKKDENLYANTTEVKRIVTGNLTEHLIYYNSSKTPFKILNRLISFLNYKKHFRKAIIDYFKNYGKPDYVHVHVAMNAGVAALWVKKKWNIPYFVTEHWVGYYRECVPSIFDKNFLFRSLNKRILKKAALFFPVSKGLGETVKQNFVDIPFCAIPNVVSTEFFNYKPSTPAKFRFIHISYMNYQKNPEGIMQAAAVLKERGYVFEILMLGDDNNTLRSMANKYELLNEFIFFQQPVSYKEVAVQMQKASALLLFSRFENLPCVILEGLCCGLPVISSRVGGVAEAIDVTNGILVESGDTVQLAKAMQTLMENYPKYDRNAIATTAAEKYNYEKVGRQYYDLYNKMLSNPI